MRSKLVPLIIGLVVAAGTSVTACSSSSDPVPDDTAAEATEYQSVEEDPDYQEFDTVDESGESDASMETMGAEQSPQQGQPLAGQPGQQQGGEMPQATGPVATVDGDEIPAQEFNQQLEQLAQQSGGQLPPQMVSRVQGEIIDQLVQQKLLDDAVADAEIEVSDDELDARLEEFRREFEQAARGQGQLGDDLDFDDFVQQMGMSPEELREVVEETVAIEKLLEEDGIDMPTDEDVRDYYEENQDLFTIPESVDARHLLVGVMAQDEDAWDEAEQKAQSFYVELTEEDGDITEIADEQGQNVVTQQMPVVRSEDIPVDPNQPQQPQQPQEIEEAAFELDDGEFSEPIRTQQGWLIMERIEHTEEQVEDFDEVEEQLESELRNQAMEQSLDGYLADLEADAEVERHPENIE